MDTGVKSIGIKAPLIREGDNIVDIVVDSVFKKTLREIPTLHQTDIIGAYVSHSYYNDINNKDIIGITESVVARAQGNYVTVDEIANDIIAKFGKNATICLINPIYSRNRFSMILKGIARAAKKVIIVMPEFDEVGNPRGINPFTGVNIEEYYKELCENEGCECEIEPSIFPIDENIVAINCNLRPTIDDDCYYFKHFEKIYTLKDICSDKCEYGVLGSNKATEERLKLFPNKAKAQAVVDEIKAKIKEKTGKDVIVCIYGDGCFKDPVGGIWEFADPVSMPAYTDANIIESTPNEMKLKSIIDNLESDAEVLYTISADKSKRTGKGQMGTTPRLYRDLLASLMDLTSGSGDKGTPIVLIQNYFNNYAD